ncbi:colicin V [Legionella beliardensis]|uniref:Colicin V n=1 Tax=Legionella beliardensis TaxID=91822 RepID=A0A378I2A7_9GAMM|nr:CvpA family protein [Legionella beliardensis]STX29082.1 colicin V [Legionella beliardensis]
MQWNYIDLAIIGIISLSVITGLFRGFVKELVALCVWIVAIWVAFHYSYVVDPWLQSYIQNQTARTIITFVAVLLAIIILGAIVNLLLSLFLKRSGLSGTDRLLGMAFGFVRGVFIVSLIMVVIKMTSLPYQQYIAQSQLYAQFDPMVNWLSGLMPGLINQVKSIDSTRSIVNYINHVQVS